MEGAIRSHGLLSLPSNPQMFRVRTRLQPAAVLKPQNSIRLRTQQTFFSRDKLSPVSPLKAALNGQRLLFSPLSKPQTEKKLHHCQAAAAGAAVPPEKPKFLGVEIQTLKKIVPLGLMFFCILFNYTILRDTKDVLVVTAKGSSAEIIPFLKTWVNLPMAVGFMLLYSKLSDILSKEALFYTVIFPFIAFFGAFAFLMYPMRHAIHPTALADRLLTALGPRFLGPIAILRIWSFCLFYVMAELWGSVVISVLFWGFANQVNICVGGEYIVLFLVLRFITVTCLYG
jgi:ATP:ADP antiporter, AAA family